MQNLSVEMFNCWLCALITLGHHSSTSCVSEINASLVQHSYFHGIQLNLQVIKTLTVLWLFERRKHVHAQKNARFKTVQPKKANTS